MAPSLGQRRVVDARGSRRNVSLAVASLRHSPARQEDTDVAAHPTCWVSSRLSPSVAPAGCGRADSPARRHAGMRSGSWEWRRPALNACAGPDLAGAPPGRAQRCSSRYRGKRRDNQLRLGGGRVNGQSWATSVEPLDLPGAGRVAQAVGRSQSAMSACRERNRLRMSDENQSMSVPSS